MNTKNFRFPKFKETYLYLSKNGRREAGETAKNGAIFFSPKKKEIKMSLVRPRPYKNVSFKKNFIIDF